MTPSKDEILAAREELNNCGDTGYGLTGQTMETIRSVLDAALTAETVAVVTVEEVAAKIKAVAHIAYPWNVIQVEYPNGLKIVAEKEG